MSIKKIAIKFYETANYILMSRTIYIAIESRLKDIIFYFSLGLFSDYIFFMNIIIDCF